jgi:hypothetical protein
MSKKCFDDFRKATGRSVTVNEQQELLDQVRVFREEMSATGQSPDTIRPDGLTNIQKRIQDEFAQKTRNKTENIITKLQQLETEERFFENIDNLTQTIKTIDPKATDLQARERAVIGTILNTNDTRNTVPFELMMRTEGSNMFGDFNIRAQKVLDETDDLTRLIEDPEFKQAFWSEYYTIVQNPNTVKAISGNVKAFNVAKAFFEETSLKAQTKLTLNGKSIRLNRTGVKVRFQKNLVEKLTEDEFVEFLAPRLSTDKHGNLLSRQEIAREVYTKMNKGDGDWRTVGKSQLADEDAHNPFAANEDAQLVYKDGVAFTEVNKKFSENQTSKHLILQHISELGREVSLTRFLGPDHKKGLDKLRIKLEKDFGSQFGRGSLRGGKMKGVFSYLQSQVEPAVYENSKMVTTFGALRAIQAGAKLGSAVITALMDIPIFIVAGRRLFNLNIMDTLGSMFRWGYKGAPADEINYARYVLEMSESWLDNAGERFGLIDGMNNMSKFEKFSSGFAEKIFSYSGLNWWTRGLQAKAAGVYSKHLGELIKAGRSWDSLGPQFKSNLEKFGLNKKDWADLLRDKPLDLRDRIDLFQIQEKQFENSFAKKSLRSKLTSVMADAVDTMVMKPGQFDVLSGAFFADPQAFHGQLFKSLTQFKAHPISFTRKLLARSIKDPTQNAVSNIAALTVSTTLMSVAVLQLKQFIAGKEQFQYDSPDFWSQAIQQAGMFGIVSDMYLEVGGGNSLIKQILSDEKERTKSTAEIISSQLGPLLTDGGKLMEGLTNITVGGVRYAKDIDDGAQLQRGFFNLTKFAGGLTGLQNLWFTKLLYRKYVSEFLFEAIDPKGYRRREKRLKKDAYKNRQGGAYNNVLFDKLPNLGQ